MVDETLQDRIAAFYARLGLPPDAWHIGPEHPALESLAIALSRPLSQHRILEIGVQAGGFAIPVALAAHAWSRFSYTGVDNLRYTNAVPLRHVEAFLREQGVAGPLRFVESDSTRVLRTARPGSFDVILLDHYKPKYPLDLHVILSRNLLSEDGLVVLHDVLAHAAPQWEVCKRICEAFGCRWTTHAEVPQGAAVVTRGGSVRPDAWLAAGVYLRWYAHAATLVALRAGGTVLRALGVRRHASPC